MNIDMKTDGTCFGGLCLTFLAFMSSQGHPYHTEGLTCMAISSDSTRALTASKDGSLHIVNITTGKVSNFVALNILMF
jgi:WD40 repeat protein